MESFISVGELIFTLYSIAVIKRSGATYVFATICKVIGKQARPENIEIST